MGIVYNEKVLQQAIIFPLCLLQFFTSGVQFRGNAAVKTDEKGLLGIERVEKDPTSKTVFYCGILAL